MTLGSRLISKRTSAGIGRLRVEQLEDRRLLAVVNVAAAQVAVDCSNGVTSPPEAIVATNLADNSSIALPAVHAGGPGTMTTTVAVEQTTAAATPVPGNERCAPPTNSFEPDSGPGLHKPTIENPTASLSGTLPVPVSSALVPPIGLRPTAVMTVDPSDGPTDPHGDVLPEWVATMPTDQPGGEDPPIRQKPTVERNTAPRPIAIDAAFSKLSADAMRKALKREASARAGKVDAVKLDSAIVPPLKGESVDLSGRTKPVAVRLAVKR